MAIKKKVFKILKLYPGLNSKIEVGDCFIKIEGGVFYQRISKEEETFTDKTVYIVSKMTDTEFFEEFYINIELK
tara:strand:- start:284 stop:505 length:222 start_codon:yes stop_codon:yes gene_type:complete